MTYEIHVHVLFQSRNLIINLEKNATSIDFSSVKIGKKNIEDERKKTLTRISHPTFHIPVLNASIVV